MLFIALAGHLNADPGSSLALEPALDNYRILHRVLKEYQGGHIGAGCIELLNKAGHYLPRLFVAGSLEDEGFPSRQFIVANEKDLYIGYVSILHKGNDILFASYSGGDSLSFNYLVYRFYLVAKERRFLKIKSSGGFFHPAFQISDYLVLLTFKK